MRLCRAGFDNKPSSAERVSFATTDVRSALLGSAVRANSWARSRSPEEYVGQVVIDPANDHRIVAKQAVGILPMRHDTALNLG